MAPAKMQTMMIMPTSLMTKQRRPKNITREFKYSDLKLLWPRKLFYFLLSLAEYLSRINPYNTK